MKKSHIAK